VVLDTYADSEGVLGLFGPGKFLWAGVVGRQRQEGVVVVPARPAMGGLCVWR
jgi:hypothetical protein